MRAECSNTPQSLTGNMISSIRRLAIHISSRQCSSRRTRPRPTCSGSLAGSGGLARRPILARWSIRSARCAPQALANNWNQNIANQRGILGDTSSLYGTYIGNQGNLLNAQQAAQLDAVGAAPGAYQQQYLPAERMGQVGSAYEDLATRQLQSQLDKFNTNQQAGWNRLGAYNQNIGGHGRHIA